MGIYKHIEGLQNAKNGEHFEVQSASFDIVMGYKAMTGDEIASKLAGVSIPSGGRVYKIEHCNTRKDRHKERFGKDVLDVYAEQINEKGSTFNLFHKSTIPVGRVLPAAYIEPDATGEFSLMGYVWVNEKATIPDQKDITVIEAIETKMLTDVSVEIGGTIRYNEPDEVVEWYVDPKRKEITEYRGLALVQNGAQYNAGIKSAKSIDNPTPEKEKSNIVNMSYRDKFFVGGKEYAVSAKSEANEVKAEGIDAIVTDFKAAFSAKEVAETAQKTAEAERDTLKSELEEARKPQINDIENYSKSLKKEVPAAEDLAAMNFKGLKTLADALKAEHDAGITPIQKKSVTSKRPEGFFQNV